MGRKARMLAGLGAVVAVAATSAMVFGAGADRPALVKRTDAIHMRARIVSPASAEAAKGTSKPKPSIVYGATKPQVTPPNTDFAVTLGGCPRGYHVTNASFAALHQTQAHYFTIRGSGPLATKKGVRGWFIDVNNSNTDAAIGIKGVGFIVCQR